MSATDVLQVVATVAIVAVAAVRIPSAVRRADDRPLCLALVALGLVMVQWFVDRFGIVDVDRVTDVHSLTTLLRHLFGLAATQATLAYLALVTNVGRTVKARRLRYLLSAVVAVGMTTTFALVPRLSEVDDFFTAYAGEAAATAYWVIFMSYLAIALGWALVISVSYRREADKSPLRTGLGWVAAGATVGVGYIVHKNVYVIGRQFGIDLMAPNTSTAVTAALFGISLVLITVGTTIPLAAAWLDAARDHNNDRRLKPLWATLVEVQPTIVLGSDAETGNRLYRRYIEIQDGLLELRDFSDVASFASASAYAKAQGMTTEAAEAFAEAVRIRVAAARHRAGARVGPDERCVPTLVDDYQAEVARLARIAQALRNSQATSYADSLIVGYAARPRTTKEPTP
ncbi:hypothetical protein GCM10023205_04690 [Yinghuangia aomiensis]|uniref:DUF6545 domain-containing protein n=1 Tax=Yinghuangia aomiensis TaxID=676205 RepID=A0ABP9GMM7_9ACTN